LHDRERLGTRVSPFAHIERLNAAQSLADLNQEMVDLCAMADRGGFLAIWPTSLSMP
jgi:hypothetical protein